MSLLQAAPPPATRLGRHRRLSPLAGVHVSPIQLGAMSIGDKWGAYGMGETDKEGSFKLLDAFYKAGGNFIDTANNYQNETSELFIGEWMEQRGIRDQIVVATKYTTNYKLGNDTIEQKTHYTGNNVKSLHISVEASLKKLRTDYIDILYLHWWDYTTSVEEVMNNLHNLVATGKVLYLGISDSPAWVVVKANSYARAHGKTPFSIYQGAWNILLRDMEREIIPMCLDEGLAIAPYNVLAGGKLRSDAEEERRRQTGEKGRQVVGSWERNEVETKISRALEKVAAEVGAKTVGAVAIAYVMQKTPNVFPVVGGRKVEHLMANIEALEITLTKEQIAYLESIIPFSKGWPHDSFGDGSDYSRLFKTAGTFDLWPRAEPIRPKKD